MAENNDGLFKNIDPDYPGNPFPFMRDRIENGVGFIATIDQDGNEAIKAVQDYAKKNIEHLTGTPEKVAGMMHKFAEKIISSPGFNDKKVFATLLPVHSFERYLNGLPSAHYLWRKQNIVPLMRLQGGFSPTEGGNLKPTFNNLNHQLSLCVKHSVYGAKITVFVNSTSGSDIEQTLSSMMYYIDELGSYGITPVLEVDTKLRNAEKEVMENALIEKLDQMLDGIGDREIVLQLTLPTHENMYESIINHPNTLRVCFSEHGVENSAAMNLLRMNPYGVAAFRNGLIQGLQFGLDRHVFERNLNNNIEALFRASVHGTNAFEGNSAW